MRRQNYEEKQSVILGTDRSQEDQEEDTTIHPLKCLNWLLSVQAGLMTQAGTS